MRAQPRNLNKRSRRQTSWSKCVAEVLEQRTLFDGVYLGQLTGTENDPGSYASTPLVTVQSGQATPSSSWLAPAAIRSFYNFNNIVYGNASISGDGSGQTIAIIDWGYDPDIASDLGTFDSNVNFTIGTASVGSFLTTYAQSSSNNQFYLASSITSSFLPTDASSFPGGATDNEISLDVEWKRIALAPGAKIDLVEAQTNSTTAISSAINYAKQLPGVSTVSMSFGTNEGGSPYSDSTLSQPGVTFLAASGDGGSYFSSNSTFGSFGPDALPASTGLNGSSDSFGFLPLVTTLNSSFTYGNLTLTSRVSAASNVIQAGISIRNGTSGALSSVANVSLLVDQGSVGKFQYRSATNGITSVANTFSTFSTGTYLAINRQGTSYTAYDSSDGITWNLIGSVSIPAMSGAISLDVVGAATASSNNTVSWVNNELYFNPSTGASSPASSSNVVAVGGSIVNTDGSGSILGETTAWGHDGASYAILGSGGGYSTFESRPAYQSGLTGLLPNGLRAIPDVAFDAGTPVAIYDTDSASQGWDAEVGTSFSAPAWAALFAVIDQGRALVGLPTLTSSQTVTQALPTVQTLLYGLPSSDFNDITSGSNGAYSAGSGYDLVTGLGTPHADKIAADLTSWVFNQGFETGSLYNSNLSLGWSSTGTTSVVTGNSHNGTYAAKLGSTSSASTLTQVISGLLPDTTYQLTAWAKVDSGSSAPTQLIVENFGDGTLASTFANSTSYTMQTITFTTGPSTASTISATVVLSRNAGTGSAYFDDLSLTELDLTANLGFESGTLLGWTTTGSPTIVSGSANSGTYAAALPGAATLFQVITGLQPNTPYHLTAFARNSNADTNSSSATLSVQAAGSAEIDAWFLNATNYSQQTINFVTGPSSTAATITLTSHSGSYSTLFDDIALTQALTYTPIASSISLNYLSGLTVIHDGASNIPLPQDPARLYAITPGTNNLSIYMSPSAGSVSVNQPVMITGTGTLALEAQAGTGGNISLAQVICVAGTDNHLAGTFTIDSAANVTSDGIQLANLVVNGTLQVRAGDGLAGSSKVNTLTIAGSSNAWTGTLNLNDNLLIVQTADSTSAASALAVILNQIIAGTAGSYGIISSTLSANPGTAIADVNNGTLTTPKNHLRGLSLDDNSLIIAQALGGDLDLSGTTDFSDLVALEQYYNHSDSAWNHGDLDRDGTVGFSDLVFLEQNYNHSWGMFS